jgi:hypothetical protein
MFYPTPVLSEQEEQQFEALGYSPEAIDVIVMSVGICPLCNCLMRRCDTMGRDDQGRLGHLECVDPKAWAGLAKRLKKQLKKQKPINGRQ